MVPRLLEQNHEVSLKGREYQNVHAAEKVEPSKTFLQQVTNFTKNLDSLQTVKDDMVFSWEHVLFGPT